MSTDFWETLQSMVNGCTIHIDRPRHSAHPRYPEYIYPHDYGYLEGTTSGDGDGIDCWIGSLGTHDVTGIVTVIDPVKKDSEIKILLGCTKEDMQEILQCHKRGSMNGILTERA